MCEGQLHDANCAIALTYSNASLPANWSLRHSDFQNFAKKFRRDIGRFRYFMCGEYGDEKSRPHYHAVIFGHDFAEDRVELPRSRKGFPLYASPTLSALWPHGRVAISEFTFETAAYVARYCIKKVNGPGQVEAYSLVDPETGEVHERKPEYTTMSRNPGIAKDWLHKYWTDVYPRDSVWTDGRVGKPPAYFDKQLRERDEELYDYLKEQRTEQAEKRAHDQTPERLAVREKVAASRLRTFSPRDN